MSQRAKNQNHKNKPKVKSLNLLLLSLVIGVNYGAYKLSKSNLSPVVYVAMGAANVALTLLASAKHSPGSSSKHF